MEFTVAIPCFNSPERVDYLLESLFKFSPELSPDKVIVSDDCSPNIEKIKKVVKKYNAIFTSPPAWGCVGENTNHVVSLSKDNLVFVINDDLLISKGTLEVMQKFWEDNQHLKIGAAGFTFIQSYQLEEKGVIKNREGFYPPAWNKGNLNYNNFKFKHLCFPTQFLRPILTSTPSGPCFAINKAAWEECGKFHEFGMWEGGLFHTMWEKGWVIFMVPTPPMLHLVNGATADLSDFLKRMYVLHPEKRPYEHEKGQEIYKNKRSRYYLEDVEHIFKNYIYPKKGEMDKLVNYDFDASAF